MNYWPRWINSIRKRTAELSLIEMGAYDRLLDHYYAEEKPLPGDLIRCCRLAGAVTKPEQDAVRYALDKFFVLAEDGYRQERADEELTIGQKKIEAAQANGQRGGRPRGSSKKPSNKPSGFSKQTHDPTQSESSPSLSIGGKEPIGSSPPDGGGDGEVHEVTPERFAPSVYGSICGAIRRAGIGSVDPGFPAFRAAVDAGATSDEFVAFAREALDKDQPFKWLIGAVVGERKRAAQLAGQLHRGAMPNKQVAIETRNRAVADEWAQESTPWKPQTVRSSPSS